MFDLEQSIAEWRRGMLAGGVKSPVPLEELESHLREDLDRQTRSGLNASQAFAGAVREIGRPDTLRSEFTKNERKLMKRTIIVLIGIFGVLCGTAFILPALAWYRDHGAMPAEHLEFLVLGILITVAGLGASIYGFKKQKA